MEDILESSASYNTRLNNDVLKKLAQKEEPRFLSILLKDKECLADCINAKLKTGSSGHFWDIEARHLFGLISEYYKKYQKPLTRTAIDSIMDSIDKINGIAVEEEHRAKTRMYWDKVYSLDSPVEDYELLKENINNRFVQWQAYELLKEELEKVARATSKQSEIVKAAKDKFVKIEGMEIDKYMLTMGIKEGIEESIKHITNRREHPEDTPAIMTGIKKLDDLYHGFNPGSYTIITGMINGGKTTLMFNIAFNMAKAGYGVVYVSLEKEAVPLFTRLLSLHALIDYNRIKIGGKGEKGLSDYYYGKLTDAAKDLNENIIPKFECIQAAQGVGLAKILAEVEKVKTKMKIDVLVVDYLGCIGAVKKNPTRPDLDEAFLSQELQAYGRVNRLVTITASQLKTPSAKEIRGKSKKATADDPSKVEVNTEDLAGSKMIIADADCALGVILNSDQPPSKMYVFGTKARDDESRRTITLDFDGRLGRVCDPILEPGQVTAVDQLLYNTEITEDKLKSDDGLFSDDEDMSLDETTTTTTNVKTETNNSPKEDDFDFMEEKASPESIAEETVDSGDAEEDDDPLDIFSSDD